MENSSINVFSNAASIQQTAGDLNKERSIMNDKVAFVQQKQEMMLKHVSNLAETRNTWISRFTLPRDQKNLLREKAEKDREGLNIILTNQNQSMAALCGAQTAFMKELANTITVIGRTNMKAAAYKVFNDLREQMDIDLAIKERNFYQAIDIKLTDAEQSTPLVQGSKMKLIQRSLERFENDLKTQQDQFSGILKELL